MWKMIRKQIITFARTSFTLGPILLFILYTLHLQQRQPPFVKIKIQSTESKVNRTTSQENYIINTPLCKILQVNLNATREFKHKYYWNAQKEKCKKKPLAVIENQNLKLLRNKDAFQNCCYREVERGQLTRSDDLLFSDWLIKTSTTCSPIPPEGIQAASSFIRIECNPKSASSNDSIGSRENHVDFASIVLPPQNHLPKTKLKTNYWDERRQKNVSTEIPPNILMIGIDGVSRLNMERSLPKTRNYALQNDFIEFKGFTTMHGTDSFRNFMAMLIGIDHKNPPCATDGSIPLRLDNCPFIWKQFSMNQYITAFVEDSAPDLSIFNENRRGFGCQPVDYTLRTLMVAAQAYLYEIKQLENGDKLPCLNGKESFETGLKYIQDFVKIVGGSYPYFLISLFRTLTTQNRGDINALHRSDTKFLNLLKNILETNYIDGNGFDAIDNRNVNDTVIILYSTHGKVFPYLYPENSFESSHEAALPILLVRLPPNLKNNYPEWYRNLQINSERLASALDIHETLNHFQKVVALKLFQPHRVSYVASTIKNALNKKQSVYSLFQEIPLDRTCDGAKTQEHCQCNKNHSTHGLTGVSNSKFSKNWNTTGFDLKLMMTKNLSIYRDWALEKTRELIKNEMAGYNFKLPNNGSWNNYVLETEGEPIRTLIATTWGSGSTFLGEIFENHPGTYYHFEPLIKYNMSELKDHSGKNGTNVLKHLFNCNLQHLAGYWSQIISNRWIFEHNTRLYSFCKIVPEVCWDEQFLDRMCSLFPFQTAVTVRLRLQFARPLLEDPKLKVRVIYLVRDPRGTMQSRFQLPWCTGLKACGNYALLCKDLVDDYHEAEKLRKEFPDKFLVVRYEDMASDMHAVVKKILAFSHMEYHPTIQSFVDEHTKTSEKHANGTYWNSKANPFHSNSIRDMRNNFTMVRSIQRTCKEAMHLWGYKIARNSYKLLDFNINPIADRFDLI